MAPLNRAAPPTGWHWAAATSAVLFLLRWHLGRTVGFGDAEALYVCYSLHPAPAYLDHPGLIGALGRVVFADGSLTPLAAHQFTAVAATLVPWIGVAAARGAGGTRESTLRTFYGLALAPELAIGLFAFTPDLPLASSWLGALGFAAMALGSTPGSRRALVGCAGAGALAGVAILSKASGALLLAALVAGFSTRAARPHLRSLAPWFGLVVALLLAAPLVRFEHAHGYPLLVHRFSRTQAAAGFSLRNVGALVGGQLVYVTPPFLVAAYFVLRELARRTSAVDRFLFLATVVPGVPLAVLCLWSKVAEPHWLAPAYLALAIGASRIDLPSPRLDVACAITGMALVLFVWVWVSTPLAPRYLGHLYVPRYDLANDLYAWRAALPTLDDEVDRAIAEGKNPVIVGPHWTVCAQVHAGLGPALPVGCLTPIGDDFATWYPERDWAGKSTIVFVTDDRFDGGKVHSFPGRTLVSSRSVRVYRGGRPVRVFHIARLDRDAPAP